MTKLMKSGSLKLFASLITLLTVFTVNSACAVVLGQDEEPDTLKRFKKIQ